MSQFFLGIVKWLFRWFVRESEPLTPVVATKPADGLGLSDDDRM